MSDDLRQRYADLVTAWFEPGERLARLSELLAVRDEELERLRCIVADYENTISWDTTCREHARLLDECRRQEERAEKAEAALARVSAAHQVHRCKTGHVLSRTPNPCVNDGMCSCGQPADRCPTRAALNATQETADVQP